MTRKEHIIQIGDQIILHNTGGCYTNTTSNMSSIETFKPFKHLYDPNKPPLEQTYTVVANESYTDGYTKYLIQNNETSKVYIYGLYFDDKYVTYVEPAEDLGEKLDFDFNSYFENFEKEAKPCRPKRKKKSDTATAADILTQEQSVPIADANSGPDVATLRLRNQ